MDKLYMNQDPDVLKEIQEDHLEYLRRDLDNNAHKVLALKRAYAEFLVLQAERCYPNHPTTLEIRKDFDFEFNQ